MEIEWLRRAKRELRDIYKYYINEANESIAEEIVATIERAVNRLEKHPRLGHLEEAGEITNNEYRGLAAYKHYKVIYLIEGNAVLIISIFDTRQDPRKLKRLLT